MGALYEYHCNRCSFSLPAGEGCCEYVIAPDGRRVRCPHPIEDEKVREMTGLTLVEARRRGLTGCLDDCVCRDCLEKFGRDIDRDGRTCPECGSPAVATVRELVDAPCPACGEGVIEGKLFGIS